MKFLQKKTNLLKKTYEINKIFNYKNKKLFSIRKKVFIKLNLLGKTVWMKKINK